MTERKNQWFSTVAEDLAEYNLPDDVINRIAADYELMAEASRLANKFCLNYLSIGSTEIKDGLKVRYTHGSFAGNAVKLSEDVAVAMFHDPVIAVIIQRAMKTYRRMKKIAES